MAAGTTALSYLPRTIVFANGKGGVGKTSLVSNLAGLFAQGGLRVLTVDLDPQGNLATDLGYPVNDGHDLFSALITGGPAPVIKDVGGRTGLDSIPGGPTFADVIGVMLTRTRRTGEDDLATMLWTLLSPLAGDYDLILIDTPPGDATINESALSIAHSVVIPTRADDASVNGLEILASRFVRARQVNPALRLLGVALFAIGSRSTRVASEVRKAVEEVLEGSAPVFEARIRLLESAAYDQRAAGRMIHELEAGTEQAKAARLSQLRGHLKGEGAQLEPGMHTRNAAGIADDYEQLAREILRRQAEIDKESK